MTQETGGPVDAQDAGRQTRPNPTAAASPQLGGSGERSVQTGNPAFSVRARVIITPWTDVAFAAAVREVLQEVRMSPEVVMGTGAGAVLAQRLLRERGYQRARVIDERGVDEAMRRVARWRVLRDG